MELNEEILKNLLVEILKKLEPLKPEERVRIIQCVWEFYRPRK